MASFSASKWFKFQKLLEEMKEQLCRRLDKGFDMINIINLEFLTRSDKPNISSIYNL